VNFSPSEITVAEISPNTPKVTHPYIIELRICRI
jgi:hypothetical protein